MTDTQKEFVPAAFIMLTLLSIGLTPWLGAAHTLITTWT